MPFGDQEERNVVQYQTAFDTAAGNISFENEAFFLKREAGVELTLSDTPKHTALRVLPLDEKCRELNRKYILPVGYKQNNIFLKSFPSSSVLTYLYGSFQFNAPNNSLIIKIPT